MSLLNFFKNKSGQYVIIQWPNWPLWLAIIIHLTSYLPLKNAPLLATWSLIPVMLYWAYLEITSGDSPFRRVLGTYVALGHTNSLLKLLGLI